MADMTLEEALAAATVDSSTDSDILTISNDLRTITIPESIKNLGVESDEDVNRIHFKMPKMYKDVDLSGFDIRINYINGNDGDKYIVEDKTISEDYITFSWLVGRNALKTKGSTRFIVCLKKTDSEGIVQKEFNTTLASINVLEGLETTEQIMQKYPDVIEQILKKIEGSTTITPDQISEAVEEYMTANQIQAGATEEQAKQIEQNTKGITELKTDIGQLSDENKAVKNTLNNIKYPTKLSELNNDLFYYNKTEVLNLSIDDFAFNDDGTGMGNYSYTSIEPIYDTIDIESIDYHIVGLYSGESIDCEKSESAKILNDHFIDLDIIDMYVQSDGMLQITVNNDMFVMFQELYLILYKIDLKKIPLEVIDTDSLTHVYAKDESGEYNIQKTLCLLNYTNIETRADMYELSENLSFKKNSNHICFGYTPTYVIQFRSPFTTNKDGAFSHSVGYIIENVEVLTGEEEKKFTKVFNSDINKFVLHYDIRLVTSNSIVTLTKISTSMLSGIYVDENLNVYAVMLLYNTDTKSLKEMIKRIA